MTAKKEGAEVLLISRQPVDKMNAAKHEIDDARPDLVPTHRDEMHVHSAPTSVPATVPATTQQSAPPPTVETTDPASAAKLARAAVQSAVTSCTETLKRLTAGQAPTGAALADLTAARTALLETAGALSRRVAPLSQHWRRSTRRSASPVSRRHPSGLRHC
jgi:hypothetical protein